MLAFSFKILDDGVPIYDIFQVTGDPSNVCRLTSERGLPALCNLFDNVKFKGKGHEVRNGWERFCGFL